MFQTTEIYITHIARGPFAPSLLCPRCTEKQICCCFLIVGFLLPMIEISLHLEQKILVREGIGKNTGFLLFRFNSDNLF